jgi:putative transposase
MRIVDPETGRSYVEKRRVRYNEPGQPRELTFCCCRHYAFLGRGRTRVSVREGRRLRHRFWQPGGRYDRNITSTEVLRAVIDYIHANPVRRGLVARAEDWEWSSARCYAGLRPAKLEMDWGVLAELARG